MAYSTTSVGHTSRMQQQVHRWKHIGPLHRHMHTYTHTAGSVFAYRDWWLLHICNNRSMPTGGDILGLYTDTCNTHTQIRVHTHTHLCTGRSLHRALRAAWQWRGACVSPGAWSVKNNAYVCIRVGVCVCVCVCVQRYWNVQNWAKSEHFIWAHLTVAFQIIPSMR